MGLAMKPIAFAACCGTLAFCGSVDGGIAQTSPPPPQIFSIAGITVMLPRKAGTKDAPDVLFPKPLAFGEKGRSEKMDISGSRR